MPKSNIRESFDGSESNFSLLEHGGLHESYITNPGEHDAGQASSSANAAATLASIRSYYPISTIMSNPRAATAAQTISTNLSNLNPLRPTTGPKTGATRGKAATPIVLSDLPKVSPRSFDNYIASIKEEYTTWSQIQTALADAPVLEELDDDEALLDEETAKRRKAIKRALESSNYSNKTSKKIELPPLTSVPEIFFDEAFNLANPRTFDVVTGSSIASNAQSSGAVGEQSSLSSLKTHTDLATDQILQEKLSHWLDIVELHLNVEISLRSASFFSALSNLQELDTQSAEAVKQIAELKTKLQAVDESVARKGLLSIRQGVRRRRLTDLDLAVQRVKEVLRAVKQAEDLGEAGATDGALDLVEEIEREWQNDSDTTWDIPPTPAAEPQQERHMLSIQEEEDELVDELKTAKIPMTPMTALRPREGHHPPVRIARITSLSGIPARLASVRSTIANSLENELIAVLLHAISEAADTLEASQDQWRSSPASKFPLYSEIQGSITIRARAPLSGLVRCGKLALDDAVTAWKEASLKRVRQTLRDKLPSNSMHEGDDTPQDDQSPSSRSSVDGVRASLDGGNTTVPQMSQEAYLELLRSLHTSLLSILVACDLEDQSLVAIVSDLLGNAGSSESSKPPHDGTQSNESALNAAWVNSLQSDLGEGVQALAEFMNVRLARLAAGRSDIHSRLPLLAFWNTFQESWQFVLDCETVSRKMIVGLRGVIVGQAKSFLQHFHQQTLNTVASAVEHEQWSPVDVPSTTQIIVNRILQGAVESPSEWDLHVSEKISDETASPAKQLSIEDRTYFAVRATLQLMESLEEYLKIVINLPLLSTDVMSRLIELLKQFNSRVCQMVLGAGAMRSAGLKNITAKHLAMASQTVSVLISIIPYTRECLRRHLRAKQAIILVDFDKLKRDCQEHQNEIHAKLVAIMGDRLAVHCKTLQEIDWEKPSPTAEKPNAYMETLIKEAGTLHKVLFKYLPGSALEVVMMQVLSAINSRLAEEYSRINLKSEDAKARMLCDVNFLKEKVAEFKGFERTPPGAELEQLVQTKRVEIPRALTTSQAKTFSTPSLSQPRKSLANHQRSNSSLSAQQHVQEIAKTEGILAVNSSAVPEINQEAASSGTVPSSADASVLTPDTPTRTDRAENVTLAQSVPLPLSPDESSAPLSFGQVSESASVLPTVSVESHAENDQPPTTPSKDERVASPPLPEKTIKSATPPPASANVKNRLAGLFAKRPSIPTIDTSITEGLDAAKGAVRAHPESHDPQITPQGPAEIATGANGPLTPPDVPHVAEKQHNHDHGNETGHLAIPGPVIDHVATAQSEDDIVASSEQSQAPETQAGQIVAASEDEAGEVDVAVITASEPISEVGSRDEAIATTERNAVDVNNAHQPSDTPPIISQGNEAVTLQDSEARTLRDSEAVTMQDSEANDLQDSEAGTSDAQIQPTPSDTDKLAGEGDQPDSNEAILPDDDINTSASGDNSRSSDAVTGDRSTDGSADDSTDASADGSSASISTNHRRDDLDDVD